MRLFLQSHILLTGLLIVGCGGSCCQQEILKESIVVKGNQTPIAIITGLPIEFKCGEEIRASGLSSFDFDGTVERYEWTLDGERIGEGTGSVPTVPCDNEEHQLCLTVEDDKGLKSIVPTCQSIRIEEDSITANKNQTIPQISKNRAHGNYYRFSCLDSQGCDWSVTKYFKDSIEVDSYSEHGIEQWINVDPSIYKSIDLTLTTTDYNGAKNTFTQSYIISND